MGDSLYRCVSSAATHIEELRLPYVRFSVFLKALAVGVPFTVLLHETSSTWMPSSFNVPVVSWFQRRWRTDPQKQLADLQVFRNIVLFAGVVILFMNDTTSAAAMPSDYLERRLVNTSAVKAMNDDIYSARNAAFEAAGSVLGEEELNVTSALQQRDAALRRRYLRENRNS